MSAPSFMYTTRTYGRIFTIMKKKNEIIDEIRQIRLEIAREHNFDVAAIMEASRQRQKKSRRKVVSFITKKKTA